MDNFIEFGTMKSARGQGMIFESAVLGYLFIACATLLDPPYKLLYNATPSAPIGFYVARRALHPRIGEYVLVSLPEPLAKFASTRGYLPRTVPLLKHIAAASGQKVCRDADRITIDGVLITHALRFDGAGRALPAWRGCHILTHDEVFLLSTENLYSFDSRYFGPIPKGAIVGEAMPLWIRSR